MGKFVVKEKSFINNHLVEAGQIVEYEGHTHSNLEAVDKDAKKSKADNPESEINKGDQERTARAKLGDENLNKPEGDKPEGDAKETDQK